MRASEVMGGGAGDGVCEECERDASPYQEQWQSTARDGGRLSSVIAQSVRGMITVAVAHCSAAAMRRRSCAAAALRASIRALSAPSNSATALAAASASTACS